jgi:glycosyltransferase involved in cell wall biosynthesis
MKETVPVSVVIPVYNGERFLREAIESVRAQTVSVAEIIVVDDGSTDGSAELADSLGATVIRQPNAGVTAARNAGILVASQPWVALLDQDDVWEVKKIETQMNIAAKDPRTAMVTCDYSIFNQNGTVVSSILEKYRFGYEAQRKIRVCENGAIICELDECFSDVTYLLLPSFILVRREILERIGMFDESLRFAEDFDCFMRGLANSYLGVAESVLAHRRVHEENASHRQTLNALTALSVTEKVIANPDLYPRATVKHCSSCLPANLRHAAARLMWDGDIAGARPLLLRSAKLQLDFRTVLALIAACTPTLIARKLMSLRYYASANWGI